MPMSVFCCQLGRSSDGHKILFLKKTNISPKKVQNYLKIISNFTQKTKMKSKSDGARIIVAI